MQHATTMLNFILPSIIASGTSSILINAIYGSHSILVAYYCAALVFSMVTLRLAPHTRYSKLKEVHVVGYLKHWRTHQLLCWRL